MKKIRWGILSTASIARQRFVPAILKSEKSEIVAVASRKIENARLFSKEFSIARAYGSYEELLSDAEVDAVYIPLPNHMHGEWTIAAANAGKHVLCEKPMAVDETEALAMATRCRECGVLLMEGFMYRLNPRTLKMKDLIDGGMIGEVRNIVVENSFPLESAGNSRMIPGKGAGSIMDVGCYCINAARYFMGSEPVVVTANQRLDIATGGDTSTSALLEFDNGWTALINSSFEMMYRNSIKIVGSEGLIQTNRLFSPPTEGKIGFTIELRNGAVQEYELDAVDQFLVETDWFVDCINNEASIPLDPFLDAVPNARVIDAIRESARTHQRVKFPASR